MSLPRVIRATPLDGYRLDLTFTDGVRGIVDLSHLVNAGPVFKPWTDPTYFALVQVRDGTVVWPNDADLCPDVLYADVVSSQ